MNMIKQPHHTRVQMCVTLRTGNGATRKVTLEHLDLMPIMHTEISWKSVKNCESNTN